MSATPMGTAPLVVVTRPQDAGRRLAAELRAASCDALWCPAFDLLPPERPDALRACIARLDDYDVVVFVSATAVNALATALGAGAGPWPGRTAIGAVGAATRAAVLESIGGVRESRIVCPSGEGAADGGSEALWPVLVGLEPAPQRVLIVRAQSGRQWLSAQLVDNGVQVEEVAAYRRIAHVPDPAQMAALRADAGAGRPLAILYTSTEAVGVLAQQLGRDPSLASAYARRIGLCVHARIAEEARADGCADVRLCATDAPSILAALRAGPKGRGPGNGLRTS